MSECCRTKRDAREQGCTSDACPRCGQRGKAVELVTLKSLLAPEAMKRLDPDAAYCFCRTRDCPVVYFSGADIFTTDEVTVRVFQKENDGTVPVCYCFGLSREAIVDELERTGASTAVEEITRYVKDGKCACEIRNPQGSCCLGNIGQVVKQAGRLRLTADRV